MSELQDCCKPCCPTVPLVNVPGTPGADAYTFISAAFTVPTVSSDVVVQVLNTAGLVVGGSYVITGPAHFTVAVINGPTTATLVFQDLTGDVNSGTVIQPGAAVVPTGQAGQAGLNGENGFATLTSSFVVPSAGNTVAVAVDNSSVLQVGQYVVTAGPANFIVTAIGSTTSVTLRFLSNTGDVTPGTSVTSGTALSPAAQSGVNAYTTLTSQITIPAVGTTVTAAVGNSQWMAIGQKVVIDGPATFSVSSKPTTTSVVLTFLGYIGDLAAGNTIANGATVSPAGTQNVSGGLASAVGSGTAYTLTGTPALLAQGTSSPSVTLPSKGTWIIFATALYPLVNSAGLYSITTLLQRTNNTPGAIANSSIGITIDAQNGGSNNGTDNEVVLPLFIYTTSTNGDIIQIWGSVAVTSGTAVPTCIQSGLYAVQIA